MAGHSKWAQIKHRKAISDAKRSQIFSKLSQLISAAAREKGGDPEKNSKLRLAVERARALNMPHENIMRAIRRGTGELPGSAIEEALYEGYGPGGAAMLVSAITDNKNRTFSEIRNIFESNGGKLVESGAVKWLFKESGKVEVDGKFWNDELAMRLIDKGAQDFKKIGDHWVIYTKPQNLDAVKKECEELGIAIETAELEFISSNAVKLEGEEERKKLEKLFEALDEHPDVQEIYTNAEF